ncbi:ankyrin-3-like [Trichogramma pretiosum]|uniref:ankyrin-3-like n=1 Tax=Trichogramma pretiosum TaxID=7493 RepID=UPI000C71C0E0|nr:ankyrin-3-like [Trichogramma pretiosum]
MSDDKFDVYFSNGGDGGLYNLDYEINNYLTVVSNLQKMKKLREKVIGEMEKGRESTEKSKVNLFKQLGPLINNWKGQYPDLGKLFRREQMDWLLTKYVEFIEMNKAIKTNLLSFVIECGYKDKLDVDEGGKPLLHRTTPLHHAARSSKSYVISDLCKIYDRFKVDYIDEGGYTPFHVACRDGCYDVVEKFLELGQDPNCPLQKSVDPPLHGALYNNQKNVAELLLNHGANPNLADEDGWTPLHVICSRECDDDLAKLFFQMCGDNNHLLQVDARDKLDNTPLHLAVCNNNKKAAKFLLQRGANPNLANKNGYTPLHVICSRECDDDLAELFFQMCDDSNHPLQVDARDKNGHTPLHVAVFYSNKKAAKLLLKRGANPNVADAKGQTPLHFICMNKTDAADLAETLFQICDDRHQLVRVDRKDKSGWTPLQWAVANLRPNLVDVLLDHGAKLSNFVFPTMNHFNLGFVLMLDKTAVHAKLKVVFDLRAVVKCLEKRGYKLKLEDLQTIKRLLDGYEVFKKLPNLDQCWYDKEEFSSEAKNIEMSPNQSLYDLIRSPPAKAEEILANEDYYHRLVSSTKWSKLSEEFRIASIAQLGEVMARGFLYKRRALASLVKLTGNKLPILCYEMIIEPLTNKDLWHIYLASSNENKRSL